MAATRTSVLGVTLVELMVGVIVAGILAVVVLPQLTEHRGEARVSVLDASLAEMRSAIELYAYQHGGTYPGVRDGEDPTRPSAQPAEDFLQQLTQYTDARGAVRRSRDPNHRLGPYLRKKELPRNPFTNSNTLGIVADADAVVPPPADGETAWRFALQTGRFYANQPGHETR
jgi:type II secretory pathway pseudopilin PulG